MNSLNTLYIHFNVILIYIAPLFLFFTLIKVSGNLHLSSIGNQNSNVVLRLFFLLFFLNLAGLPPLPGFFLKLNFLLIFFKKLKIINILILIVFNFIAFYFYIKNCKFLSFQKKEIEVVSLSEHQNKLLLIAIGVLLLFPLIYPHINIFIAHIFIL